MSVRNLQERRQRHQPQRRDGRQPERRQAPRRGVSRWALLSLLALSLIPVLAAWHLSRSIEPWTIPTGLVIVSGITFILYRNDKRSAQAGAWRTPESTLHLAELLGGWPAAFLAQRMYRHKIAKVSYQVSYWLIVLAHQLVCFDYLNGWNYSESAFTFLR